MRLFESGSPLISGSELLRRASSAASKLSLLSSAGMLACSPEASMAVLLAASGMRALKRTSLNDVLALVGTESGPSPPFHGLLSGSAWRFRLTQHGNEPIKYPEPGIFVYWALEALIRTWFAELVTFVILLPVL